MLGAGALVVLSGGQDSTLALFWAKSQFGSAVKAISFNYGQRHARELQAAAKVAELAQVDHEIVELGPILKGTSPLVNKDVEVGKYQSTADLPGGVEPTFVPCRNALFLTIAANRMVVSNFGTLVTGVCEADYGGYPDCRRDFITELEQALSMGLTGSKHSFNIQTPLMNLSKADSVRMAKDFDGCWEALAYTHTCYDGGEIPCLKCHACLLRARGFYEAGYDDPMILRLKKEGKLDSSVPGHGLLEVVDSSEITTPRRRTRKG